MPVDHPELIIVIPTYNEAGNIQALLERILAQPLALRVLIVDDNSPDGTAQIAESIGDARVMVIRRINQRGYGSAVLTGFREALKMSAPYVLTMDSDFSHNPDSIPALLAAAHEADVAIGSRYCPGGGTLNWPRRRQMLSRYANRYVQFMLGIPYGDSTSGFRCYRADLLRRLDFDSIQSDGYSFLVEVLYRCCRMGACVRETPILFIDRLNGHSKINTREIFRSIYMVPKLRWFC